MSLHEQVIGQLKRRDGAPIFAEPWNAQALAMADLLIKSGRFSQSRWAETLAAEVAATILAGHVDNNETYYTAVLSALERLLVAEGSLSYRELERRREDWANAYLATSHGKPVILPHE